MQTARGAKVPTTSIDPAAIGVEAPPATSVSRVDPPLFTGTLGIRLDMICPAGVLSAAVFSGHRLGVRLSRQAGEPGVEVVRHAEGEPCCARHDGDILFGFVLAGGLRREGEEPIAPTARDAFVIPPGMAPRRSEPKGDLRTLEVAPIVPIDTQVA